MAERTERGKKREEWTKMMSKLPHDSAYRGVERDDRVDAPRASEHELGAKRGGVIGRGIG